MLLRIAFFLAIAFFIYLVWRERRDEIATWSARERIVFYGSALLIIAALGLYFWHGWPGYEELGFIAVLACSGFAMWRVWRDRHSYRL
jgi:Na+/melibiose symporter-like transporter